MTSDYQPRGRLGGRPVENFVAFVLMLALILFLQPRLHLSIHVTEGMIISVAAAWLVKSFQLSMYTEGNLFAAVCILIGVFLGWAAFGMAFVAWCLYLVVCIVLIRAVNPLRPLVALTPGSTWVTQRFARPLAQRNAVVTDDAPTAVELPIRSILT
jgi:hypothetical protein